MTIQVALRHQTRYQYDRTIEVGPQIIRLRPAPHCRTPILSYSLNVRPKDHFLNWQQDPHGNYQGRVLFTKPVDNLTVDIDLIAEMTVINPFDFFLEEAAEEFPFRYEEDVEKDLLPFLERSDECEAMRRFVLGVDLTPRRTIDFLVDLNQRVQSEVDYLVRMEPGVQSCEETLTKRSGSCRDSAWLLVQVLRRFGLAARFASGYLIQLCPDEAPLEGPAGPTEDFTDLHAWTEVYLPGAGWIGLDPTSGLFAGEGHIPLACTPSPTSAAPISGSHEVCESTFEFSMSVKRIHEDPRITKPYTEDTWQDILRMGETVDKELNADDVRLTMGGEPTFVSIDDMYSAQWQTDALGEDKEKLADQLVRRLHRRFGNGGLLHFGQGKWYPGEALPRWSMRCYWRPDGQPVWEDEELLAESTVDYGFGYQDAYAFANKLAERLDVDRNHVISAFEDAVYYLWKERRLPTNVDVKDNKLENEQDRNRVARIFEQGLTAPVGCVLPLQYRWWDSSPRWHSGLWQVRSEEMFLLPGDSSMGLRLPLDSLQWVDRKRFPDEFYVQDPLESRVQLQTHASLLAGGVATMPVARRERVKVATGENPGVVSNAPYIAAEIPIGKGYGGNGSSPSNLNGSGKGLDSGNGFGSGNGVGSGSGKARKPTDFASQSGDPPHDSHASNVVRTALCVEARGGRLHVFLPPVDRLEPFLMLCAAIEDTAKNLGVPIVIEGYGAPQDHRLQCLSVTPDPGVIEVNVHPAGSWSDLVSITEGVYEEARQTRLGTEKFDVDGTHTGTGGGNHIVLGGATPKDSPFLRRPDVLKSLVGYWHNHPSLSYIFSGRFIGPTSQAPRVDEGRRDSSYELEIGLEQIKANGQYPPWHVDRVFRDLLVDMTGNHHRAEFCIDKLYSPDGTTGRLGLLELRSFEMPPHVQMSLAQQLLIRTLVARFWKQPYEARLSDWGTSLHDRFMLPYFLWQDFSDVIQETQQAGFDLKPEWFLPHQEFRFPKIGNFSQAMVDVELRLAVEPWYVLGEEQGSGGTSRYVDSSLERMQVHVRGMIDSRHVLMCNGRRVPLHPTGTEGEFVAGVRYRAWQPPSCLHPTIPIDQPVSIELIDSWSEKSLGGCRYYVGHPGGVNPETYPINSNEAESRRAARFIPMGHSPGKTASPVTEVNPRFPMTLDLRRNR